MEKCVRFTVVTCLVLLAVSGQGTDGQTNSTSVNPVSNSNTPGAQDSNATATPLSDTADQATTPTGETPAGETPAGETPAGETPTGETPTGETPTGETPTGETPTGDIPSGETPTGDIPSGETPTGETPAEETPTGETPTGEIPAGETPTGETPTGETPTGEIPAGEIPAEETPTGEIPAGEIPAGETPTGEIPAGETPTGEIPAGETPTGEIPAEEIPAGEETPAEETPADDAISENDEEGSPFDGIPTEATPVDDEAFVADSSADAGPASVLSFLPSVSNSSLDARTETLGNAAQPSAEDAMTNVTVSNHTALGDGDEDRDDESVFDDEDDAGDDGDDLGYGSSNNATEATPSLHNGTYDGGDVSDMNDTAPDVNTTSWPDSFPAANQTVDEDVGEVTSDMTMVNVTDTSSEGLMNVTSRNDTYATGYDDGDDDEMTSNMTMVNATATSDDDLLNVTSSNDTDPTSYDEDEETAWDDDDELASNVTMVNGTDTSDGDMMNVTTSNDTRATGFDDDEEEDDDETEWEDDHHDLVNGTTSLYNVTDDEISPETNITAGEETTEGNVTSSEGQNTTIPLADDEDDDDEYDEYDEDFEEESPTGMTTDDAGSVVPSNETSASNQTYPQPTAESSTQAPEKADFVVYDNGRPCLLASLNITLHFQYHVQVGLVRETYETISKKNTQDGSSSYWGSCESNASTLSITWNNNTFTLNLTFLLQNKSGDSGHEIDMNVLPPGANASSHSWQLQQMSLSYDTANDNIFPGASPALQKVSADDLRLFRTPQGMAYMCKTPKVVTVEFKDVDLTFNFVHLMPFGAQSQYFSNDTVQCSGDLSNLPMREESYTVPLIVAAVLASIVMTILLVYATVRCVARRVRQAEYRQME